MIKCLKFILLAIALCVVPGMSAQMTTHVLQSRQFSELYINGAMNVECRHSEDSAGMIIYKSTPQVADALDCHNAGDRLNISMEKISSSVLRNGLSTIVVYYSGQLSTASFTGSGSLTLETPPLGQSAALLLTGSGKFKVNNVTAMRVSCSVTGSGTMSIAGKTSAKNVTCTVSGSGAIEIAHVNAKTASVTVNGSGDMLINGIAYKASFALKGSGQIDASNFKCTALTSGVYGSGKVYYNKGVSTVNMSGKKENIIAR